MKFTEADRYAFFILLTVIVCAFDIILMILDIDTFDVFIRGVQTLLLVYITWKWSKVRRWKDENKP